MQYFSVLLLLYTYARSHPKMVQKGVLWAEKKGHILLKNIRLKVHFQYEGNLHANCLICTMTIYSKCLLFHFLVCGIRMQIPIL